MSLDFSSCGQYYWPRRSSGNSLVTDNHCYWKSLGQRTHGLSSCGHANSTGVEILDLAVTDHNLEIHKDRVCLRDHVIHELPARAGEDTR